MTMVCVPIGGMIGGIAASQVLPTLGWRALFVIGGVAPLALCLLLFLLPESPGFLAELILAERQPAQRLALAEVFQSGRTRDTLSLWLTTSCCLLCVYMSFSWLPTLLTAQGLSLAEASSGLAFYNLGGVAGALLCGALIARFGSRVPMLVAAFGAVASVLILNLTATRSHAALLTGFAIHGLFVNAVQVTSLAMATHIYPTGVCASGVAFALAMTGTFLGLALIRNHIPAAGTLSSQAAAAGSGPALH